MSNLQQAVVDFGRESGLPLEGVPNSGELQFRLEDGGTLGIVAFNEEVIIHWSRPLRYDVADAMLTAMKRAAELRDARQPISLGLRRTPAGDWLVVGTRFSAADVNLRRIHQAVDFLRNWCQALEVSV